MIRFSTVTCFRSWVQVLSLLLVARVHDQVLDRYVCVCVCVCVCVHDQVLDRNLLERFGFEGWVQSLGLRV